MNFELLALESLPCGCVAGDFRAWPMDVEIISIEAKGPHCTLQGHAIGETLDMGALADAEAIEAAGLGDPLADREADELMS